MASTFLSKIRTYYYDFSTSEKKIADYLKENYSSACYLSIQELAQKCDTSISTVSRFSKRIGCQNYQELRLLLKASEPADVKIFFKSVSQEDSLMDIASNHFVSSENALVETHKVLTEEKLNAALTILKESKTLGFFGIGGSSVVTLNGYHRFIRSNLPCVFSLDYHMQLMTAGKLDAHDCAIVVSHSGRNKDILRITKILHSNRVPVIGISSNASSRLAKESTVSFISVSEETTYRPEAVVSLVSQLAIVDVLFSLYSLKTEQDSAYFSKIREIINETREPFRR